MNAYGTLIAATDNDAYNALVCTDFAPEFGRNNVFQPGRADPDGSQRGLPATLGGRAFGGGLTHAELARRAADGEGFLLTEVASEKPDWDGWHADHPGAAVLAVLNGGTITFLDKAAPPRLRSGDRVLWLAPTRTVQPSPADDEDD